MKVCVYCGGQLGNDPAYEAATSKLGIALAKAGHELVYGGGKNGLMGVVADSVLGAGGRVVGIMPHTLVEAEQLHKGLSETHVVADLTTRKAMMMQMMDVAIVLPGAFGTLDELFEQVTLFRLGAHSKPTIIYNVNGFYDALIAQIDLLEAKGFMYQRDRAGLKICNHLSDVLTAIAAD